MTDRPYILTLIDSHREDEVLALPIQAFEAFKVAVDSSGKRVPGLARLAKDAEGLLKDESES